MPPPRSPTSPRSPQQSSLPSPPPMSLPPRQGPPTRQEPATSLPPKLPSLPTKMGAQQKRKLSQKSRQRPGKRFLSFDRRLGARWVAGADEAGRGSLAGPLVVAGVLLDYGELRDHRVRPLALLNDSKQLGAARREELFCAILGCAERIAVRVISHERIDREGLHRTNLR